MENLTLAQVFMLVSQKKWHYLIQKNINHISKEQWLAVRLNEDAEPFYWDLVGMDILAEEVIYWVETQVMIKEDIDNSCH